jgi:D-alanyl-D-alanine carboxypeptidase
MKYVVLALLLISSLSIAQEKIVFPADIVSRIQAYMDLNTNDKLPPGMVVRIDTEKYLFESSSGYSNLEQQTPMTPDAAFRIGSITKMFTSVVVLQLAEEGVLTLDDPLSIWLPDVTAQLHYGEQITLRQLLNHTSGVFNYTDRAQWWDNFQKAATVDKEKRVASLECQTENWQAMLEAYVYDHPAVFEPGKSWSYSNTGFHLLGMVIEKATNEPLARVYRKRITEPLGMTHTFLECVEPERSDMANGYSISLMGMSGLVDVTRFYMTPAWSAGGLVSTSEDLSIFIRALFAGELFTKSTTLGEMLTPANDVEKYGLGIYEASPGVFGHNGGIPGFVSHLSYDRERDMVIVVLYNFDSDDPSAVETHALPIIAPLLEEQE